VKPARAGALSFAPGYLLTRIKNLPDRPRLGSKFTVCLFEKNDINPA